MHEIDPWTQIFANFHLYLPIILNRMNILQVTVYAIYECSIVQLNSISVNMTNGMALRVSIEGS